MFDLSQIPAASSRRLAVRVTKDALRQVRAGHPWIFETAITSVSHQAAAGDLAVVFDDDRNFAAVGLFDPSSPIRVRVLHQGKPTQIDSTWWAVRLEAALAVRRELAEYGATTGYRLVHGENDGLPGLIVDRYADTLVVKVYSSAWLPHLATIVPMLVERLGPASIVARLSREVKRGTTFGLTDGAALHGETPTAPVLFLENGLTFEADVVHGQKTGHFLDQRDNRSLVHTLASGRRVLDVFACTGGFSVYAAAGRAKSVHSVDISTQALATAQRNMAHNGFGPAIHAVLAGDAFEVMARLANQGKTYGVVVVDPPSFARKGSEVQAGIQAYRKLTQYALALVEPGGVLVQSSCSSRITPTDFYDAVFTSARVNGFRLRELQRTGHAVDHPIGFIHGEYLKTLFAQVD